MTSNKDDNAEASTCAPDPQPDVELAVEEPLIKKRRTKNFQLREDLAKSRGSVSVVVPPFEPFTFDTWDAFTLAWNGYMARTKTMYRRRSSSTTTYWNNKHKFKKYPVPEDFKYATMSYWCTHGCIQPSRGNGVRTHLHNRYTGCSARITADVVFEMVEGEPGKVRWLVRVRNQIAQHNHRISDEIYHCYTNNSSVPDELLLGPDVEQKQEMQQDDTGYEPSARILTELDPMGVDPGFTMRSAGDSKKAIGITAGSTGVSGLMLKEVLANEHKMNMAVSEMQPLLDELKSTPSRVIHKRLQDVSEMVAHLLAKWHQDRVAEETSQAHAVTPLASLSVDQAAASSDALSKAAASTIPNITSLPPGAAYYLAPRVEQLSTETSRTASANTDSRSGDEATPTRSDRELLEKNGQVLGNQRGHSEAV